MKSELETAVLQHIEKFGVEKTPWVYPVGIAAQLASLAVLVESELYGDGRSW